MSYLASTRSFVKPTIAGILNGIAHQFLKPKTQKEGKGTNRTTRSILTGTNTFLAVWIGEGYIWPNVGCIEQFFNMMGNQGINVFSALLAASTQMLGHSYISTKIPKGTFFSNFLYNLGSIVIADYTAKTSVGYFEEVTVLRI